LKENTPPQSCKSSDSDSGQSTPACPTRIRRRLPAKPGCRPPPDSRGSSKLELGLATYENPSTSPATSGHQMKQPTSREWCEVSAHLTSVANDPNRKLEYHLAPIDGTPKGLGPYLAQVNRTFEKLVQRLAPVVPPTPYAADGPSQFESFQQHRDVSTPRGHSPETVDWGVAYKVDGPSARQTENKQQNGPSVTASKTDNDDIRGESRAQPTPPGEMPGASGPDTQPRHLSLVPTPVTVIKKQGTIIR